jgi:hypothetical protein
VDCSSKRERGAGGGVGGEREVSLRVFFFVLPSQGRGGSCLCLRIY